MDTETDADPKNRFRQQMTESDTDFRFRFGATNKVLTQTRMTDTVMEYHPQRMISDAESDDRFKKTDTDSEYRQRTRVAGTENEH